MNYKWDSWLCVKENSLKKMFGPSFLTDCGLKTPFSPFLMSWSYFFSPGVLKSVKNVCVCREMLTCLWSESLLETLGCNHLLEQGGVVYLVCGWCALHAGLKWPANCAETAQQPEVWQVWQQSCQTHEMLRFCWFLVEYVENESDSSGRGGRSSRLHQNHNNKDRSMLSNSV